MNASIPSICGLLFACVLIGATVYGCDRASRDYYRGQELCVQAGGSWVPSGGSPYNAACVYGRAAR